MRGFSVTTLALITLPTICASLQPRQDAGVDLVEAIAGFEPIDVIGELASEGLEQLLALENSAAKQREASNCSLSNVVIRQDW